MPGRRLHRRFDQYLTDRGVVAPGRNYDAVHNRMDRGVEWHSSFHRELDWYHTSYGIRDWLVGLNAYQDTKTDYLRCAYGHIVLDDMHSRYEFNSEDEMLKSAYRSFAARGYGRKFYRGPSL